MFRSGAYRPSLRLGPFEAEALSGDNRSRRACVAKAPRAGPRLRTRRDDGHDRQS